MKPESIVLPINLASIEDQMVKARLAKRAMCLDFNKGGHCVSRLSG